MASNPWSSNPQYLSTVLNDPNATIASHAAAIQSHGSTPPRPRQSSAQVQQPSHQQGPLTAAQRSAQARGKPFHASASTTPGGGKGRQSEPESYAARQRRDEAAAILDSQEMLLWYSAARHESITQTREFYRRIVLGAEPEEPVWKEEWQVRSEEAGAASPRGSPRDKGKGKGKEKERTYPKKRYSSGGPHVTYGENS